MPFRGAGAKVFAPVWWLTFRTEGVSRAGSESTHGSNIRLGKAARSNRMTGVARSNAPPRHRAGDPGDSQQKSRPVSQDFKFGVGKCVRRRVTRRTPESNYTAEIRGFALVHRVNETRRADNRQEFFPATTGSPTMAGNTAITAIRTVIRPRRGRRVEFRS
jgi:hypothetical protein